MRRTVCGLLLIASALLAADRPRITGIADVAYYSHDLAGTKSFYATMLGFEPASTKGAITYPVNQRQSVTLLEERAPATDRLAFITLETSNADQLRRYLASKSIPVPPLVTKDRVGRTGFSVTDPDGHIIWFVENKARHKPPTRALSKTMAHTGIIVGSVEAAMRFYRDTLGFQEFWRGSRDDKTLSWINMRVPDGDEYIEFMLYNQLPAPTERGSQHHICLFVDSMEQPAAEAARRAPAASYQRPIEPRVGTNRRRQLNLFDADGTRTELMETRTVDGKPTPSSPAPPPRP
jgi:lactoylglutathione lyase